MQPIKEFLDRIKWDPRERADEYVLFYLDRIERRLKPLKYRDIIRREGIFIVALIDGRETYLPMHRIRKAEKSGRTVWQRQSLVNLGQ